MIPKVAVHDGRMARSAASTLLDRSVSCCAEVPSELLDEQGQVLDDLIGFAFDVLSARYLDVRILPAATVVGQIDSHPSS